MRKNIATKVIKDGIEFPIPKNPCPTCSDRDDCRKGGITCCMTYMHYDMEYEMFKNILCEIFQKNQKEYQKSVVINNSQI